MFALGSSMLLNLRRRLMRRRGLNVGGLGRLTLRLDLRWTAIARSALTLCAIALCAIRLAGPT